MINAQDIRDRLTTVPFVPFQIVTSSGNTYEVRHPDVVIAARRYVHVGVFDDTDPIIPERIATVSMLHITELVPLPSLNAS